MPTKGPSLRYGNTRGSKHRGKFSKNINYAWAKDFNKNTLKTHYEKHGKDFGAKTKEEYASKAVHFANAIDRQNYKSVIDWKGSTYKYNTINGAYAIITEDGYVVTYHKPRNRRFSYHPKKGITKWIKI